MRPDTAARLWECRAGSEDEFTDNLMVRSAVERQFEILGEALNRLRKDDPETADRVPDIDKVVGMRNVIAHEYGDIDYEIVWAAVTKRLPVLLESLDDLIGEAGPAPEVHDP